MNSMAELDYKQYENDHPGKKGERVGKTGRCGW